MKLFMVVYPFAGPVSPGCISWHETATEAKKEAAARYAARSDWEDAEDEAGREVEDYGSRRPAGLHAADFSADREFVVRLLNLTQTAEGGPGRFEDLVEEYIRLLKAPRIGVMRYKHGSITYKEDDRKAATNGDPGAAGEGHSKPDHSGADAGGPQGDPG